MFYERGRGRTYLGHEGEQTLQKPFSRAHNKVLIDQYEKKRRGKCISSKKSRHKCYQTLSRFGFTHLDMLPIGKLSNCDSVSTRWPFHPPCLPVAAWVIWVTHIRQLILDSSHHAVKWIIEHRWGQLVCSSYNGSTKGHVSIWSGLQPERSQFHEIYTEPQRYHEKIKSLREEYFTGLNHTDKYTFNLFVHLWERVTTFNWNEVCGWHTMLQKDVLVLLMN